MDLLLAVIDDLYTFARDTLLSLFSYVRARRRSQKFELPAGGSSDTQALITTETPDEEEPIEEFPPTFRSTAEVIESPSAKNTVMYSGSERTPLFRNPTMEFDGVRMYIPYGAMVMVLQSQGRWSRVAYKSLQGWVLRDDLQDRSAHVYPDFTIGEPNRAEDPNTLRVRACIADEFGAGRAELSLQSSEYVLYRLARKGITISWPRIRPRIEGVWHEILRGKKGIQIGVHPCGGCIMESTREDGVGHIAYVEAVFPDDTISISEADFPSDGIYNERILTKEEWRELKPVFIDIR